jgi:tetratricopeptide (TPR) repeat protein
MHFRRNTLTALAVFCLVAGLAHARAYKPHDRDINMDAKYRTLGRLCYGAQMEEAEAKAVEVLDERGYRGTRYECWVWDKLGAGYEKKGDSRRAIECYQNVMNCSDPRKGSYTRARDRVRALGGTPIEQAPASQGNASPAMSNMRASAEPPANPTPPVAPRPAAAQMSQPVAQTQVHAELARDASGAPMYRDPPRDINMDAKYRSLGRLCYGGEMAEARAKAIEVLDDRGFRGTRYECWVWDKLAAGYEKQGDISRAIECYRSVMDCSDPRKGSFKKAEDRIRQLGGNPR